MELWNWSWSVFSCRWITENDASSPLIIQISIIWLIHYSLFLHFQHTSWRVDTRCLSVTANQGVHDLLDLLVFSCPLSFFISLILNEKFVSVVNSHPRHEAEERWWIVNHVVQTAPLTVRYMSSDDIITGWMNPRVRRKSCDSWVTHKNKKQTCGADICSNVWSVTSKKKKKTALIFILVHVKLRVRFRLWTTYDPWPTGRI